VAEKMFRDAENAYPNEWVGAVFVKHGRIEEVVELPNVSPSPHSGYAVDATTLLALLSRARAGLDLCGVVHSHPDGGPEPSDSDREFAIPGLAYWIIPVHKGVADREQFKKIRIDELPQDK
jgi:proteasome lid subunit RPN8/RPN11